jgi:hypothetical protein
MLIKDFLAVTALLVSQVTAHGLVTRIKGANGVDMPGLTSGSILLSPTTIICYINGV